MSLNTDRSPSRKQGNMEGSDDETLRRIRPLVSIDFVRVENLDKERIKIDETDDDEKDRNKIDESDVKESYFKVREPKLVVAPAGTLRRAIFGDGRFVFSVNFRVVVGDCNPITSKIATGAILWDPDQSPYDKPLEQVVSGEYGSVRVGFSVIRKALCAAIDIVWMNESEAKIYGTIKAVNLLRRQVLFDRSDEKGAMQVYPLRSIYHDPIWVHAERSHFPIQMGSQLTIQVELWDHLSRHHQSILGEVHFTPIFGKQQANITGKNGGGVRVSIIFE